MVHSMPSGCPKESTLNTPPTTLGDVGLKMQLCLGLFGFVRRPQILKTAHSGGDQPGSVLFRCCQDPLDDTSISSIG